MAEKREFSPSGLARNLAPLRAAFCGSRFAFMQKRAVVFAHAQRAHLYQDYGTSNRQIAFKFALAYICGRIRIDLRR